MTRDETGSDQARPRSDDDRLAELVRVTAGDWTMPPQRLDRATWRDRVAGSGARRQRRRLPRLAIPLVAAVAVAIALAFTAVWLDGTRPSAITGSSPGPTGGTGTAQPTASDPKVVVNGALPEPANVLVAAGADYRVIDLSTGTLGPDVFGPHSGPTTVVARPGGGWLCICGDWDGSDLGGPPSRLKVTLAIADATGTLQSETTVRETAGRVDPTLPSAAQEELVDGHASISSDGRFAFLGWSVHEGAEGWKVGIDVIDVAAGRVIGSTGLPTLPSVADDGQPVTRVAPDVDLAASTGSLLVSSFWFVGGDHESPPSGVDHWSASFDGTSISAVAATRSTRAPGCDERATGTFDTEAWWVVCSTNGTLRFDRIAVDGTLVGSTPLPPFDGLSASLVDRSGRMLYMWSPAARTLARIDIASGTVSSVTGQVAAAGDPMSDLARAFGRWIAPRAVAKIMVEPGLVLSPDGTRIYTLGADIGSGETVASQGVFVFDAATLEQIARWPPAADLTSIAVSPDGAWLYAAGQPGFSATGAATGDPASVMVYATGDGSVHLTAGRLGYEAISFPRSLVP